MRTIFIDSEFKCHINNDGAMKEIQTDSFDGKCNEYIEGFRFVPAGESWTRADGEIFNGEMKTAWKPLDKLEDAQREYERERLTDAENALAILLGGETA